jgi:tRNA G18 (ribose-2'-O)-methylase SpoU
MPEIHPENFRISKKEAKELKRYPVSVFLENIRSLYNVGSIFRTADACLFDKVYLTGYTGIPPRKEISKTALGAEEIVSWKQYKNSVYLAKKLKKEGVQLIALETGDDSIRYQDFKPKFPVCLMLGNEIDGLSDKLLELADVKVNLPMRGRKNSLNVSVAFGVAAYELAGKYERK